MFKLNDLYKMCRSYFALSPAQPLYKNEKVFLLYSVELTYTCETLNFIKFYITAFTGSIKVIHPVYGF